MKNDCGRCPGCGKHCVMGKEGCKYGVKYFEKQQAEDKECKWEKFVENGGLVWRLLMLGRNTKKALKKNRATEAQLMGTLTAEEKEQLSDILEKLESASMPV